VNADDEEFQEFLEIFQEESLERLVNVSRSLEGLGSASDEEQRSLLLDEVDRELHTIKGSARLLGFAELARTTGYQVRFIEFMPLDADRTWTPERVLTGAEVRELIEAQHPLVEIEREPSATARSFRFADGAGEIGFINPVSEPFCADCNRLRLTAEGKLRTCLFSIHETDLREPLRAGASDAELGERIRDAVWRKELKHHVGEPGFRPPPRSMSAIGG